MLQKWVDQEDEMGFLPLLDEQIVVNNLLKEIEEMKEVK